MTGAENLSNDENIKRFSFRLAIVVTFLAAIPWLVAQISVPPGSIYIGSQFSSDDQMVYYAWMNQAMNGSFTFDNRFAIEQQPGLTLHLYFWLLGVLAIPLKGMGAWVALPLVSNVARLVFTFLFVVLLGKFVRKLDIPVFVAKTGLVLSTLGGGLGFGAWKAFGRLSDSGNFIGGLADGRLPIDVWQPEAFVFSSSLVNGLFMVSLCLIITVFLKIWEAQESWKPVPIGALSMLALMNIHSYDVLIVLFTFITFGLVLVAKKQIDWQWVMRALVIGLGAIPAALWFMNVLSQDEVFRARAETLTYSGTFKQLLLGILPLFVLGILSFRESSEKKSIYAQAGILVTTLGLFFSATGYDPDKGYYLSAGAWLIAYILFVIPLVFGSNNRTWLLWASWGVTALIIPYFPQLFQRKLGMALVIPWGFLAAYGFDWLCNTLKQGQTSDESFRMRRNLVSGIVFLLSCATSLYWFQREILFIRNNVTSTSVQPVFLSSDIPRILDYFSKQKIRVVVVARPGIPGISEENPWGTPYLPDLNPIISGFTPAYTYAGHWSETPNYLNRRQIAEGIFNPIEPERVQFLINESQATHLVQPLPETFPELPSGDLSNFGTVVFKGRQFQIIELNQ